MPKVGEKAQKAWAEFKESWDVLTEIEKESLDLFNAKAEVNYEFVKGKLDRARGLLKKSDNALKRYLHYLKRGE